MSESKSVLVEPQNKFLDRAGLRGFPWVLATVLFGISYGWFWNVRSSYWVDDWLILAFRNFLENPFLDIGLPPWSRIYFSNDLFSTTHLRFLNLFALFGSAVLVFGLTSKFKFFSDWNRKFFCLIFLLMPYNSVTVSLMTLHYSVGLLLFFLAWYLKVFYNNRNFNIFAVLLFFLSFQMHSLIAMFIFPLFHVIYIEVLKNREIWFVIKQCWYYFLIPVVYILMRVLFWPSLTGYQSISFQGIKAITVPLVLILVVISVFCCLIRYSGIKIAVGGALICGSFCLIFVALFPYLLGGFLPSTIKIFERYATVFVGRSEWGARHLLPQSLGIGLFCCGVNTLIFERSRKLSQVWMISVLFFLVTFCVSFGFEYVVDYSKQKSVVAELKVVGKRFTAEKYMFADHSVLLNARGRPYKSWDWLGLVWTAYGDDAAKRAEILDKCEGGENGRFVQITGPETHWQALKNWVSDGDMGFKVTVDDTPGACKPELMKEERVAGAIPILFYFTGAKG